MVFDQPPLIAIEEKKGRKYVKDIGRSACGFAGASNIVVHNPFDSMEPLFPKIEEAEALMKHAIREVHNLRALFSPKVALKLNGRVSSLSESEKVMLNKFSYSCGIFRLYIFLDGQQFPSAEELKHSTLVSRAHFTTKVAP